MLDKWLGYFSLGWRTYTSFPFAFLLGGALLVLISTVTFGILLGPCLYGLAYMARKAIRGEEVNLADAFIWVEKRLGASLLAGIVGLVFIAAGTAFFMVLGWVVAALMAWVFASLADDDEATFREALFRMFDFVEKEPIERGLFSLVMVLVGGLGFLIFWVGGLLTAPWAFITICVAYYRETHPEEEVKLPEPPPPPAEPTTRGADVPAETPPPPPAPAAQKVKKVVKKKAAAKKKAVKKKAAPKKPAGDEK